VNVKWSVNNEPCRCRYAMRIVIAHLHLHGSLFTDHLTFTFTSTHSSQSFLCSLLLVPLLALQFILYFECAGHTSCRHISQRAVTFIRDDPFQGDMTVLHDNVYWRNGLRTVSKERRIEAIDRAVQRDSQFVVHRRKRQHLDVVNDAAYCLKLLHAVLSVVLYRGTRYFAHECDRPVRFHLSLQPIEHRVIGQSHQLVTDFFLQRLNPARITIGRCVQCSWIFIALSGGEIKCCYQYQAGEYY